MGKKAGVIALLLATSLTLSGCAHGFGETIDIVKRGEQAKQNLENMVNADGKQPSQTIGTVSTSSYTPVEESKGYVKVDSATLEYSNDMFLLSWMVSSEADEVNISVYAYPADTSKENQFKLYDQSPANLSGVVEFQFPSEIPFGTYAAYIKVTDADGNETVYDLMNTFEIKEEEDLEGLLENISATVDGDSIDIAWSPNGCGKFSAMLLDPDTNEVISESTVVETKARLHIPEGYSTVMFAVASYQNDILGPYKPQTISVIAENTAETDTNND